MTRVIAWLIGLLVILALFGPQLAPIGARGTGLVQNIGGVLACDAVAIGRVTTDPSAAADTGCASGMMHTLERSPTARLVRAVR